MRTVASRIRAVRRRGQVLLIMLGFTAVIGMLALLAFDAARLYGARRELHEIAVSAARAGANETDPSHLGACPIASTRDCAPWVLLTAPAANPADFGGVARSTAARVVAAWASQLGANGFGGVSFRKVAPVVTTSSSTPSSLGSTAPTVSVTVSACVDAAILSVVDVLTAAPSGGCRAGETYIETTTTYRVTAGN
jgi:uncharacterized membrane protein